MTRTKSAYLPLATYPEAIADASIVAAVRFAAAVGARLQVTAFSVDLPPMYSPLGGLVLDVGTLVRAAEERSATECTRVKALVESVGPAVAFEARQARGTAFDAAVVEARYHDLTVLPWAGAAVAARDMAEAVIFGAGRPAILVPPSEEIAPTRIDHVAIAWDGSRVAARALGDALTLLAEGGRVTVLTVTDDKPMDGADIAADLAAVLSQGGIAAESVQIKLGGRNIAVTLQDGARTAGAQMLAMGGFGHSRFRDFVLGGATKGVLNDLRLPVMVSH